jgi:hypothetical protein
MTRLLGLLPQVDGDVRAASCNRVDALTLAHVQVLC